MVFSVSGGGDGVGGVSPGCEGGAGVVAGDVVVGGFGGVESM